LADQYWACAIANPLPNPLPNP